MGYAPFTFNFPLQWTNLSGLSLAGEDKGKLSWGLISPSEDFYEAHQLM